MQLRQIYIFVTVVLLTFGLAGPLRAESGISIRIDGKLHQPSSALQIAEGRTMIPIRFVIENEALKGKVYWDDSQSKVSVEARGQYIEFFIGDTKAWVDGEEKNFDVAPYIHGERTYIPLRFLAENLGAGVGWKAKEREVVIDFNYRPEVFAYYYHTKGDELKRNMHLFTDIAFRWFQTNPEGELFYEYEDDYDELLEMVRAEGIKTHASVVLMGKDPLHRLLSNDESRSLLIANLLEEVNRNHYDGVNIDFELMDYRDAKKLSSFLQDLKTALGPDHILSVAVYGRTGQETWFSPYQYKKIGQIADRVVVMAYDYDTSRPGPVAPLWWVEDIAAFMINTMPREKVLLGMPTYGYSWSPGSKMVTITEPKLAQIKRSYEVQSYFDENSMSPYHVYYDYDGKRHEIWMENEASLNQKWTVALENRLGGISFWRIGNGFTDLYKVLEDNAPIN